MTKKEKDYQSIELEKLIGNTAELFVDIFNSLEHYNIDITNYTLDHIGYRSSSTQEYENIRESLKNSEISEFVSERIIRGKRISVFTLNSPLTFKNHDIEGIEILEPKQGETRSFPHKLDHGEFVITNQNLTLFVEEHPEVPFDTSGINREENPEVRLTLDSGRSVGFHTISLVELRRKQLQAGEE